MSQIYDIGIIGAGPSGLIAAIKAAELGCKTIIFEKDEIIGRKLKASGGGRCNLTNTANMQKLCQAFSPNHNFVKKVFYQFSNIDLRDFFDKIGISTKIENNFYVFPESERASDVNNALNEYCKKLGISIRVSHCVSEIQNESNIFQLYSETKEVIEVKSLILASGGCTYSGLGGSPFGLHFSEKFGHHLVKPIPALVPLISDDPLCKSCTGLSLTNATIAMDFENKKYSFEGGLLFTHKGISGPAVLNISKWVSKKLENSQPVSVKISFRADLEQVNWIKMIQDWRISAGKNFLVKQMNSVLPSRLSEFLLTRCKVNTKRVSELSKEDERKLISLLTEYPLNITDTEGMDRAMVMSGGVTHQEINAQTMESKLIPNLFFAGEIIDIDGPTGGYNLQWAFSSGFVAGSNAAKKVLEHNGEKQAE